MLKYRQTHFQKTFHKKRQCNTMLHCLYDIFLPFPYAVFVKCVNTLKHNFPKAFALKINSTQHCITDIFFNFYSAFCNMLKHNLTQFQESIYTKKAMQRNVALPENYILSKLLGTL